MMTISSTNALPLAAVPADPSIEAIFSDTLNLTSADIALADENALLEDFQALLDEQMALPEAVSLPDDDSERSDSQQSVLQPMFEAIQADAQDGLDDAAQAPLADAKLNAPREQQDGDELLAATLAMAQPVDTDKAQTSEQTIADNNVAAHTSTPDSPPGESVAIAATGSDLAQSANEDGVLLPQTRQTAAPAVTAAQSTVFTVAAHTAVQADSAAQKNATAQRQASVDEGLHRGKIDADHLAQSDHDLWAQKNMAERTQGDADKSEAWLARQHAMQSAGLPARDAGGFTPAGEWATAPVIQAVNAPTVAQALNPAAHSLQLAPQASAAQWGEALGEKVALLISHKQQSAEIRIDPPHLGKLDIQIHLKDDSATINIQAHQAPTRDLIDAASFRLREFLQDNGYGAVDVNVSQREQSMAQQDGGEGRAQSDQAASEISSEAVTTPSVWQASSAEQMVLSNGMIDYFA